MNRIPGHISASSRLYPQLAPFDQRMLEVGDGHRLYIEQCGAPEGEPVVVVHGGPGGGCSPAMRRFFDPTRYRIILFDQRGCGRSRPEGSVEANTTWHLVDDMERIRAALGIERWILFGGSWGSTLALAYAQTYPERARALVLRGIFLMTRAELDWFYGGGAGRFFPELWANFSSLIPEDEQGDLIAAYHRRIFGEDESNAARCAVAWTGWESALASISSNGRMVEVPVNYARVFARLEAHYFLNHGFMDEGHLLRNMQRIADIPGVIVQGRYDMICPPETAYKLAEAWPAARLDMIRDAGHALSEPEIAARLVRTMNLLKVPE